MMFSFFNKSRTLAFSFKGSILYPFMVHPNCHHHYSETILWGLGHRFRVSVYTGWLITHNVDQYGLELRDLPLTQSDGSRIKGIHSMLSFCILFRKNCGHRQQGVITITVVTRQHR